MVLKWISTESNTSVLGVETQVFGTQVCEHGSRFLDSRMPGIPGRLSWYPLRGITIGSTTFTWPPHLVQEVGLAPPANTLL